MHLPFPSCVHFVCDINWARNKNNKAIKRKRDNNDNNSNTCDADIMMPKQPTNCCFQAFCISSWHPLLPAYLQLPVKLKHLQHHTITQCIALSISCNFNPSIELLTIAVESPIWIIVRPTKRNAINIIKALPHKS